MAAVAWAQAMTGRAVTATPDDDLRRQGAALGIDVEAMYADAAAARPDLVTGAIEVWDVNWSALDVFLGCQTQWRRIVMMAVGPGGAIPCTIFEGLDYQAVETVMRRRGVGEDDRLFGDIQAMEAAAQPILNGAMA